MLFSVRTVRGSWPHPGSGCCQVQAPPSTGAGSWAGWSGIAGSGTRLSKKWRLKWVRIPPVVNHQIVRLQTKIAPLKKCDTYKNVDRKCLKVTLGSRPKRNHFQVVVRAKNVDIKHKIFFVMSNCYSGIKTKKCWEPFSSWAKHVDIKHKIFFVMSNCYSGIKTKKNVGNHFQVEVRATRHQAENIFVMSRLFWDQAHVGNHFQVLKKLKM